MKINEIISETIQQGQVYGWIDPHGQEFNTDGANDRAHHNQVLIFLKQRGIPGTENWTNIRPAMYDKLDANPEQIDYISQALADGWIRLGARDHEFVFAQLRNDVASRPLNYLLHIIKQFKPPSITIDMMEEDGRRRYTQGLFDSPRKAISWIRNEAGL